MKILESSRMTYMDLAESSQYKELAGRMRDVQGATQQAVSTQLLGTYQEFLPDRNSSSGNVPEGSGGQNISRYLSNSLSEARKIFQCAKSTLTAQFDGIELIEGVNGGDGVRVNVPVATSTGEFEGPHQEHHDSGA